MVFRKICLTLISVASISTQPLFFCRSTINPDNTLNATNLRSLLNSSPYEDIMSFVGKCLAKCPEQIANIFWDVQYGYFGNPILFDVLHRNPSCNDYSKVFYLIVYSLREAYVRMGFSEDVANKKTIDWLWIKNKCGELFLQHLIMLNQKLRYQSLLNLMSNYLETLEHLGGQDAVEKILSISLGRNICIGTLITYSFPEIQNLVCRRQTNN